ncbi:MAG: hypothetical protein Q8T03_07060 [Bacteroidota bacterium]|nr:hypothetical protein [Bacteroidota bacterium]
MMDEKNLFSKVFFNVTGVSILIICIGSIIVNINLSFYDLIDYDLIKPRAVLVGSVYVFIILLHIMPSVFKYSILHHKNSIINRLLFIFGSASCYSLILFWLLVPEILFSPNILKEKGEWIFKIANICFIFSIIYFFLSTITIVFPPKKKWIRQLIIVLNIVAVTSIIFIVFLYQDFEKMRDIIRFEIFTNFIPVTFYVTWPLMDKYKKNTFAENVHKELITIKNSADKSQIDKFLKKQKYILMSFLLILIVIFTIGHISLYTKTIYTKMPQTFGGGKLQQIKYIVNGKIEKGLKVHETNNSVFVQIENKSIKKIKWDNIDEISCD